MEPIERTFERCAALVAVALPKSHPRRRSDAALYLAHVEGAAPLRRLAEATGRPVSSVHRAVRRVEALRDDPLLDHVLDGIAEAARAPNFSDEPDGERMFSTLFGDLPPEQERLLERALDLMDLPGAFLMVAAGAERAGVFVRSREAARPNLMLPVRLAAEMAARDWLRLASRTRASARYVLSDVGRASLRLRRVGCGSAPARSSGTAGRCDAWATAEPPPEQPAAARPEAPLAWLSSRKGRCGQPFVTREEAAVGARLRNLFERAALGVSQDEDWRTIQNSVPAPSPEASAAREALAEAFRVLGPGLSDVAWRACCLLEGLEATERRMGWSARSGKVVLKIALQRLALHDSGA